MRLVLPLSLPMVVHQSASSFASLSGAVTSWSPHLVAWEI